MRSLPDWRIGFLHCAGFVFLLTCAWQAEANEVIPPAPVDYFNDYAGTVSPGTATRLNEILKRFEIEKSNRLTLVIYPTMESDSNGEDYTRRVSDAWALSPNSAILFVFIKEEKMFIVSRGRMRRVFRDDVFYDISTRLIGRLLGSHEGDEYDKAFSLGVEAMISSARENSRTP